VEAERIQTKAEQGPSKKRSPNRLISMPRRKRPMPNRSHGTKVDSEQAHIDAEHNEAQAELSFDRTTCALVCFLSLSLC
jgi:hypothetical protein